MILRYRGETTSYKVSLLEENTNIVTVKGAFPHKEKGFALFLNEFVSSSCSYEEYDTIYREIEGGCQFSNDGSVYVEPKQDVAISVTWSDEDDRCEIRPESIELGIALNGESLETITLNAENEWKHEYLHCPLTDTYSIETTEEIEGYDISVNGTTVTYSIPFAPETPIDEQIEEIYNALADIDERVYILEQA